MKIQKLKLYTSNIEKQKIFYTQTLGHALLSSQKDQFSIKIGHSKLTFIYKENATPYHFAFNIPSNQENGALEWLKYRVKVFKLKGKSIQYFDNWDAHAIYFYDEDHNIVELIARKSLQNKSNKVFTFQSILGVSEIGIPTKDIKTIYTKIKEKIGLEIYDGGFERFCAIGDENGLFVCVDKNEKRWIPIMDKAYSSPFEAIIHNNENDYKVLFKSDDIVIQTCDSVPEDIFCDRI